MVIVAPSILSADFANLGQELLKVQGSGCKWVHVDVMDGHFVPNISIGAPVLKAIRRSTPLFLDVHLMISDPEQYYSDFITSGADLVCFHYEAVEPEKIMPLIKKIKGRHVKVGMSIKPKTRPDVLAPYLQYLDLVLVMSVEPGFGGQEFMPNSLEKVRQLRAEIDNNGYQCLIEIDGGINENTAKMAIAAGADVLVAGSYLFGHDDFAERVKKLH